MDDEFEYNNTLIVLDNGHGYNTPGKCSPDKSLKEYKWAREIVNLIAERLKELGIKYYILVPEEEDISLRTRCARANKICKDNKAILISIHINAAGSDGKWHNASGWSGWVAPKSSQNSKKLARFLYEEAEKLGLKGNRSVPKEKYWIGNFAIVRDTSCPAVLTENLFLDNKEEVEFLLSEEGKEKIVNLHVNGIIKYLTS